MNLLRDPWIPVRSDGGAGPFRLLTYRELLCGLDGDAAETEWHVSLPRDDLELAATHLLVCLTQVLYPPDNYVELRRRIAQRLPTEVFDAAVAPFIEWFDLDHPTHPFMQTRGVQAKTVTPIQKLFAGLPEGNNPAFFNEVGEVSNAGAAITAIALFNQALYVPGFGGGYKSSLRGGSPVTTLVFGGHLRRTIWHNVLTKERVHENFPSVGSDRPTWVDAIQPGDVPFNTIGLLRGLFWRPAKIELVRGQDEAACDVLGGPPGPVYSGFKAQKFGNYTVEGMWPHPHGAIVTTMKKAKEERRFVSFRTTQPAWTLLSEFVVPRTLGEAGSKEGSAPAMTVSQAAEIIDDGSLHLLIGGYRVKQAGIIGRRHELISLGSWWKDGLNRLPVLVGIGLGARDALSAALKVAEIGDPKKRSGHHVKGLGAALSATGQALYFSRTEPLIYGTFSNDMRASDWAEQRSAFAVAVEKHCRRIFDELTEPFMANAQLIPAVVLARKTLNNRFYKIKKDAACQ